MIPDYATLKIEQQESIAFLTLNRPQKLNALSGTCFRELADAAHWFNQQRAIKVVIVKGAGRTFSAGADIDDFSNNPSESETWLERRDKGQIGFRMTEVLEPY